VVDHRRAGLVIDAQALAHGLRCVVVAARQRLAVVVADALALRRIEDDVVHVAARALPAPADPLDERFVGHVDQQRGGDLRDVAERLGLRERAGKAVEQEVPRLALEPLADHRGHERVGYEVTLLHVARGLAPELGVAPALLTQQLAGRDVGERERRAERLGLGALAGAGRTQQDQMQRFHGHPPRAASPKSARAITRRWISLVPS
jgi:hypothetical protein